MAAAAAAAAPAAVLTRATVRGRGECGGVGAAMDAATDDDGGTPSNATTPRGWGGR